MSNIILVEGTFTVVYKGNSFTNKNLGTSLLKGGVARELALQWVRGEGTSVSPRDLDFWVGDQTNPLVRGYIEAGEDYRHNEGRSPIQILEEGLVDININLCLLGKEGLYIHPLALKGLREGVITRVNNLKAGKRAIRAYFFALRMGFEVVGSHLPSEHSYYKETHQKAISLGISRAWSALLHEEGIEWQPYLFSNGGGNKINPSEEDLQDIEQYLIEEGYYYCQSSDYQYWRCWVEDGFESGMVTGMINKWTGEYFVCPYNL